MSTHLAPVSPPDRPDSRLSLALSDATYHSFQDVELSEPKVSPPVCQAPRVSAPAATPSAPTLPKESDPPRPQEMRRQDSGYESLDRRDSQSQRRSSTVSVTSSSTKRRRPRPSTQRSSRSGPVSHLPRSSRLSISPTRACRSRQSNAQQPLTFFHFPHFTTSEPDLDEAVSGLDGRERGRSSMSHFSPVRAETYPPPPQTTHYWTSDRTRRLEYAAIDAASRGVRGWVMRHVVPDCFVPKSKRRVGFEDDRGSVVRYRLELDEGDEGVEKRDSKRRKGWWFSVSRH
ncbi:hypothetical protein QBC34DRAFT_86787 [Podospora aff. communis PSN243]|uniref:Uncharacterized protein n=1 Tax=Podospora aff. communis PSN243 TaxID=3040156 RepID=A0AAV9GM39_9PEZI|nr:hypothetical protein QBC34DRAFT_86787 [Podospora aff. communis PSN243]